MNYNDDQLALYNRVRTRTGTIEHLRWLHAEDAADAEEGRVPAWIEIVSEACGREPSTVYEWVKAYRLRKTVLPDSRLCISFWSTAANGITEENRGDVLDWLSECEKGGVKLEAARRQFPRSSHSDKPLDSLLDGLTSRLSAILSRSDADGVRAQLNTAADALTEARAMLERETA